MHACLCISSKSIEVKESFKFTILKRLKFVTNIDLRYLDLARQPCPHVSYTYKMACSLWHDYRSIPFSERQLWTFPKMSQQTNKFLQKMYDIVNP